MKTHLGRRPFTAMELHALFSGYIYSDHKVIKEQAKDWHFWLPLLAYYTGAFSDEIGCLTTTDIIKTDHGWFFDFHTNSKIQSRLIPIHPGLIQAGFNDYLNSLNDNARLLHDLPSKSGRYSEKARIWFSGEGERQGYLQKCGIPNVDHDGRKVAISSFRINFEQQVRISAIQLKQKELFNYLLGFNEYKANDSLDLATLCTIVLGIRQLNSQITWQRFINRLKP
ncbi:hypothetical protein ORJ66_09800 [Pseudoalteromonas tunicata]|uniref:hypothetical protein n=1 Tax=Pseudoalteromonas tunicata TaxID=314281 RepID=UPI00273F4811|nr:hypothetical protein [Pseudoalteromonas tunicata]MDP5213334.1 hypothetical protein [Pseudoalteromonas tunicata]